MQHNSPCSENIYPPYQRRCRLTIVPNNEDSYLMLSKVFFRLGAKTNLRSGIPSVATQALAQVYVSEFAQPLAAPRCAASDLRQESQPFLCNCCLHPAIWVTRKGTLADFAPPPGGTKRIGSYRFHMFSSSWQNCIAPWRSQSNLPLRQGGPVHTTEVWAVRRIFRFNLPAKTNLQLGDVNVAYVDFIRLISICQCVQYFSTSCAEQLRPQHVKCISNYRVMPVDNGSFGETSGPFSRCCASVSLWRSKGVNKWLG